MIAKYVGTASGFAGGDFWSSWNALIKHYEHKDKIEAVDAEQECFDCKMSIEDYPANFITELQIKKDLLNKSVDASRVIDDEQFMLHVLSKLPKSDNPKTLGPYQMQRQVIKEKVSNNTNYDIDDLILDLTEICNIIHEDDEEGGTDK